MNVWIIDDEENDRQVAHKICMNCLCNADYKFDDKMIWPLEFLKTNQDGQISNSKDFPHIVILDLFINGSKFSDAINIYEQIRSQEKKHFGRYKSFVIVWSGAYTADNDIEDSFEKKAMKDRRLLIVKLKSKNLLKRVLKRVLSIAHEELLEYE